MRDSRSALGPWALLTFRCPAEADFDIQTQIGQLPERARLKGSKAIAFDAERFFATPSKCQYHALLDAHQKRPADAVLFDPAFWGAMFMAAHSRAARPAVVMCSVLPLGLASRDTAPFGMGLSPSRWLNRPRNAALVALSRRVLAGANRTLNDVHLEVHGTDMPADLLNWGRDIDAIVQFTVAAFEYPRSDAPPQLHFVGPLSATGSAGVAAAVVGRLWTGHGPSSTSLRARWPTPITSS